MKLTTNVGVEAGDEKTDEKGLRDTNNSIHQLFKLSLEISDRTCLGEL